MLLIAFVVMKYNSRRGNMFVLAAEECLGVLPEAPHAD